MKYTYVIALTIYMTHFVSYSISRIGYVFERKPCPSWMPIIMFIHIAIPAILGYLIGKSEY